MEQRFYISRKYKQKSSAASKPKMDCETILEDSGFKNLGFPQGTYKSSAVCALINFFGISMGLLRLPLKSTLAVQYPLSKYYGYIMTIARWKGCTTLLILHDIKTLMNGKGNVAKEVKQISRASVIIVHNDPMAQWLREHGCTRKLVSLHLFDYLIENPKSLPSSNFPSIGKHQLAYAGGLRTNRSGFLYQLDEDPPQHYTMNLYGLGFEKESCNTKSSIMEYHGAFPPDEIQNHIRGTFGLVWNGTCPHSCTGSFGHYTKYNNPHKTSLYMLCGLPIVAWKEAAIAQLVRDRNIGFCVSSLTEMDEQLATLDAPTYHSMVQNALQVREEIIQGAFLKSALKRALV